MSTTHQIFAGGLVLVLVVTLSSGSRSDYDQLAGADESHEKYDRHHGNGHRYEHTERTLELGNRNEPARDGRPQGASQNIVERTIHPFPQVIPPSVVHMEKKDEDVPPQSNLKKIPVNDGPKTLQEIETTGGVGITSPPDLLRESPQDEGPQTLHQKTARFNMNRQRFPFERRRDHRPHYDELRDRVDDRRHNQRRQQRPSHNDKHRDFDLPLRRQGDGNLKNRDQRPPHRNQNFDHRNEFRGPRPPFRRPPQKSAPVNEEPISIEFEPTNGGDNNEQSKFAEGQNPDKKRVDLQTSESFVPELTIRNPQSFEVNVKQEFSFPSDNSFGEDEFRQRPPPNRRPNEERPRPPFRKPKRPNVPNRQVPNREQKFRPNSERNNFDRNPVEFNANQQSKQQRPIRPVEFNGKPDFERRPINHQRRPDRPPHNFKNVEDRRNQTRPLLPLSLQRPQITEYRPLPSQAINRPDVRRPQLPKAEIPRRPITHYKPHKTRPVAFPKPRPLTNNEQTRPDVEYGFVPFFGNEEEEIPEITETTFDPTNFFPTDEPTTFFGTDLSTNFFENEFPTTFFPTTIEDVLQPTRRTRPQRPLKPIRPIKTIFVTSPRPVNRYDNRPNRPERPVEKISDLPSLNSQYSILKPLRETPTFGQKIRPTKSQFVTKKEVETKTPVPEEKDNKPQTTKPIENYRTTRPYFKKPIKIDQTHQSANNQWTAMTEEEFNKKKQNQNVGSSILVSGGDVAPHKKLKPLGLPQYNRGPTGIRILNRNRKPYTKRPEINKKLEREYTTKLAPKKTTSVVKTVKSTDRPTRPTDRLIKFTNRPTRRRTQPNDRPTRPTNRRTQPTNRPTRPTNRETQPAKNPTNPIRKENPTKPSFTGFISGMFGWGNNKEANSKEKETYKPVVITRKTTSARRTTTTTSTTTTRRPPTPTYQPPNVYVPKSKTTKPPFVYVPKQIYPVATEEPKEPPTTTTKAEYDAEETSFLNNLFGYFTESGSESQSTTETITEKMVEKNESNKKEEDHDKDRWLGGFKMSHFGVKQSDKKEEKSEASSTKDETNKNVAINRYCGSKTDLEFCSVNKLYPRKDIQSVMNRCKVHVDNMVADEIAKLAEHGPLYEYPAETEISSQSIQNSDDERPWPWTQYVYSKNGVCQSSKILSDPGYARDMTGSWRIIIQTKDHTQKVSTEMCKATSKPCSNLKSEFKKSRCVQKFSYQMLMSVDPENLKNCPEMRLFRFPTACVCQVQVV